MGLLLARKHGRALLPRSTQRMSCLARRDVAEGCHRDVAVVQVPGEAASAEPRARAQEPAEETKHNHQYLF